MELEIGQTYKRTDIHEFFGGQRQGGISTPANKDVILIFSSDAGKLYGYKDRWTEDGYFLYTGEGQVGDMEFKKGNLAIRNHEQNGKKLLVFFYVRRAYVRYEGEMRCVDYENFLTPDKEDNERIGIRFTLEKVDEAIPESTATPPSQPRHKKPNRTERKGLVTSRVGQGYYRQEILKKFGNKCAVTGSEVSEILIASHIVPWSTSNDDEKLDVENGILLSPNYDALFDKHLISFADDGSMVISSILSHDRCDHLRFDREASIEVTDGMKKYLERHRQELR